MALAQVIRSKDRTGNPLGRTIGTVPTKDMTSIASATVNGYTFPSGYYFSDWGGDTFDGYGRFTLDFNGSTVGVPFSTMNGSDGILYTEQFSAFGYTWEVQHGWVTQGIFKIRIKQLNGTPINVQLIHGGNWGSDGGEGWSDAERTWTGNISGSTRYLKYLLHYNSGGSDPSCYFYHIPYDPALNTSIINYTRSNSSDNSWTKVPFSEGITVYMSKGNDVFEWVLDDLEEYSLNTAPNPPTLSHPSSTGYTFNVRPKVVVNVPSDANGNTVQIRATFKNSSGTVLNTQTSSFVTQGTGTVTLTPSVDLPTGTITVVLDAYDGTAWSSTNTYTFVIQATPSFSVQANDTGVSKVNIDNLETWVKNHKAFRGLSGTSEIIEDIVQNSTDIKASHLTSFRSEMTTLLAKVGITPTWTDSTITQFVTQRKGTHWIEIFNYLKQV
jgi:hypothetical protein